jgi:hypothetical protein
MSLATEKKSSWNRTYNSYALITMQINYSNWVVLTELPYHKFLLTYYTKLNLGCRHNPQTLARSKHVHYLSPKWHWPFHGCPHRLSHWADEIPIVWPMERCVRQGAMAYTGWIISAACATRPLCTCGYLGGAASVTLGWAAREDLPWDEVGRTRT